MARPDLSQEKRLWVLVFPRFRIFSVNSSNHSGRSRQAVSRNLLFVLLFILVLGLERSRQFPDASSSLRKRAGLEEVLDDPCGNDVEDELALELDDNLETSMCSLGHLHVSLGRHHRCGVPGLSKSFQFT